MKITVSNTLLFIACMGLYTSSVAQAKKDTAFTKCFTGMQYVANLNRIPLNDYYNQSSCYGVTAGTNYLHGILVASLLFSRVQSKTMLPDYKLFILTLGYHYQAKVLSRLYWETGFQFGNAFFVFNDHAVAKDQQDESEFSSRLLSGLSYQLTPQLSVGADLNYLRIFTYKRIDLINAGCSVKYYFNTAPGIRSWLE